MYNQLLCLPLHVLQDAALFPASPFNVFIHLIKTHHRYMVLNHGGGLNLGMTKTPTLHALLRAPNLLRLMRAHTSNLCHQLLLS